MENKKIKNASPVVAHNISFRSKTEERMYSLFVERGLTPNYEAITFTIMSGFYPSAECYDVHYDRSSKQRVFGLSKQKIQDITYTPDFTIKHNDILFVIEVKGRENDVFPIKKKLYRRWMEGFKNATGNRVIYFELFNLKQAEEAITIIKQIMEASDEEFRRYCMEGGRDNLS